jgi:hypothetical protein
MIDELKIMLAQLNPTVGALTTNAGLARKAHAQPRHGRERTCWCSLSCSCPVIRRKTSFSSRLSFRPAWCR